MAPPSVKVIELFDSSQNGVQSGGHVWLSVEWADGSATDIRVDEKDLFEPSKRNFFIAHGQAGHEPYTSQSKSFRF